MSFIINTLKELKLSKPHRKKKRGVSKYLHYPKNLISQIGLIILETDFVQRFIKGQTKPVHFISFSNKQLKFRQYRRISAETSENARIELKWFFNNFFIPDVVKMDNDLAFIGSNSAKKTISKIIKFLLNKKIIPVLNNPRGPWNNGSVEGSNSVFARNFWNKFTFNSVQEIDEKLELFNQSSLNYSNYNGEKIKLKTNNKFIPQIYFIRRVYEGQQLSENGKINILNTQI